MFAVVRTGGKQYRVAAGDKIVVEKIEGEAGASVTLGDVLLAGEGSELKDVAGLTVAAEIIAQAKGEKVIVFKKRRRRSRAAADAGDVPQARLRHAPGYRTAREGAPAVANLLGADDDDDDRLRPWHRGDAAASGQCLCRAGEWRDMASGDAIVFFAFGSA